MNDVVQCVRFEGFDQHQYRFDDYFEIFHRLGVSVGLLPDITSPIMLGWKNYQGYYLSMALSKIGGLVNIVRVYRVPK